MDSETVNKLLEINSRFYAQFSKDFSDSRSSERFNIEPFRSYLANGIHLLDAGCGNGRLAETLEREGYALDYTGIDGSAALVEVAEKRRKILKKVSARFRVVDLTAPAWSKGLKDLAPFELVVSLAVLHHIPSFDLRAQVLSGMHALVKPGGFLVLSNWQFLRNARLRSKIVPWEKLEIADERLEGGDYLLDWKRGGTGYRYVHLVEPDEAGRLASASGFQIVEQFLADNDLNLFSVLKRPERGA